MALISHFGHFLRMPLPGGFEARWGDHLEFHSGKACGERFGKHRHGFLPSGAAFCGACVPSFRVCVTTAAVAAVCDRRSLFFKCFGDHRSPLQLKNGSCHTDSSGRLAVPRETVETNGTNETVFWLMAQPRCP